MQVSTMLQPLTHRASSDHSPSWQLYNTKLLSLKLTLNLPLLSSFRGQGVWGMAVDGISAYGPRGLVEVLGSGFIIL